MGCVCVSSKRIGKRVKGIMGYFGVCWFENRFLIEVSDFVGV